MAISTKMRAVVYDKPFSVSVQEVDKPQLQQPNDIIVKITTSCICGSDLHMYEGRTGAEPGIVFGHENMGIVAEVGAGVHTLQKGDRVVMPFNVACGHCLNCEEQRSAFCTNVNPGFAGGYARIIVFACDDITDVSVHLAPARMGTSPWGHIKVVKEPAQFNLWRELVT